MTDDEIDQRLRADDTLKRFQTLSFSEVINGLLNDLGMTLTARLAATDDAAHPRVGQVLDWADGRWSLAPSAETAVRLANAWAIQTALRAALKDEVWSDTRAVWRAWWMGEHPALNADAPCVRIRTDPFEVLLLAGNAGVLWT